MAYDSAAGASYVLDTPFSEGEEADATIALKEGGTIEDHFKIAKLGPPEGLIKAEGEKPESLEHFKTEPELIAAEGARSTSPTRASRATSSSTRCRRRRSTSGSKLLEFEPVGPRA